MSEFNYLRNLALRIPPLRRNVFISYFHDDQWWAQHFVDTFAIAAKVFSPKALGLKYEDDRIDSDNPSYVMNAIRERYISDASVTLVLIGPCTHSRRYVDWELKRSLLKRNGLFGILIPPHEQAILPERFRANWRADGAGYARFYPYPHSPEQLRSWIDDAFSARTARQHLINNAAEVWSYNRKCLICGVTH